MFLILLIFLIVIIFLIFKNQTIRCVFNYHKFCGIGTSRIYLPKAEENDDFSILEAFFYSTLDGTLWKSTIGTKPPVILEKWKCINCSKKEYMYCISK